MTRKKFKGIRRRVEGERAAFAVAAVERKGYTVHRHHRLADDTGYSIYTKEGSKVGPVINIYDTGTTVVMGNRCHLFGDRDSLRMPDNFEEAMSMSSREGGAPQQLGLDTT